MEHRKSTRKMLQENKKLLDDLVKRRFVYFQGSEIYGGCAGLYDFGPVGCAIKNNLQALWREHFILEEQMLQVSTTAVTPSVVLENSGHVSRFADYMVKDAKTGQCFRADKILGQTLQKRLQDTKIKEEDALQMKKVLTELDTYKMEELSHLLRMHKVTNPQTGNQLSEPEPFNLMFKTQIGPSSQAVAYLRPETAQGMFVNFSKLLEFNGDRLPFAAAQIGTGFRNQIAPRNGLIRTREFQMAQIEYFLDPQNKSHPKFKNVANTLLPLYSVSSQQNLDAIKWMPIGEAVETKIVNNQSFGYFLVKIYQFLKEAGINCEQHLRFRQHLKNEMAHYAIDCWDAEIEMSSGWVQCVGCADREAYDLEHHTIGSGKKLVASRKFKEAVQKQQITIKVNMQAVAAEFKKDAQLLKSQLENLNDKQKKQFMQSLKESESTEYETKGKKFILTANHVTFKEKIANVMEEKFTPNVIEPSFGLGRILAAVLEHSFRKRDEKRTYLCLKPRLAPVKVSILPLQADARFLPIIADIKQRLKRCLITCKVDDTGHSIGKRYSRTDQIGIPFGITIDYETLKSETVTLRQLHTMKQLRVPITSLELTLTSLSSGLTTWDAVCKEFPAYINEATD